MEIPNLSQTTPITPKNKSYKFLVFPLIVLFAAASGFALSRFFPSQPTSDSSSDSFFSTDNVISTDEISEKEGEKHDRDSCETLEGRTANMVPGSKKDIHTI